jgi:membrane protein implicated in regulation of membrane protease activity
MSGTDATLPLVTPVRVICAVLLVAPFVALLWVSSYARLTPAFIGIPFFYWYQLLWVIVSALLTGVAYVLFTREEKRRKALTAEAGAAK